MVLWDLATDEDISRFQGHSDLVFSADISPDERYLVSSSSHEIILWDFETGDEIRRFELIPPGESGTSLEFSLGFSELEFSSDSRTVVGQFEFVGEEVQIVVAWDVETGALINQISDFDVRMAVAVNPDHLLVLSGLHNGLVELWDLETGQVIDSFDGYNYEHGYMAISPDGTRALFSADDGGILWDLVNREAMVYFDYGFGGDFSPDWRTVLSWWGDDDLAVWDLVPAHQVRQFASYSSPVSALAVSRDGRYLLASGGSDSQTAGAGEDVFRLWDIERGELLRTFTGHIEPVLDIDISPDSHLAASASADRTIKLWDLETGEELRSFLGHTDQVTGVAFSPDGKTLASSSRDRSLILWEINTGEHQSIFKPDIEGLKDLDFSPDGLRVVSAGGSGISFWDAETGKFISPLYAETGEFVFPINEFAADTVSFSPDGEMLISTSKIIGVHLWDLKTEDEIRQYQGLEKINSAVISPDSRTALLGTENGLVILWDLQTGEVLRRFNGHNGHAVLGAAFSPDGSSAFTAGEDGRIVQWSLDAPSSLDELLEWIEDNRYVSEFTCTERVLYSVEPLCDQSE
jgi:WD40 repeat protein